MRRTTRGVSGEMEPDMAAFAACWNDARFFEAHETLEPRWIQERDPGLQALIQLAAALHHLTRANVRGARTMLDRCLLRFDSAGAEPRSIDLSEMAAYARRLKREAGKIDATSLIAARPRIG
jgi:predicted metal-dependent hydrolase